MQILKAKIVPFSGRTYLKILVDAFPVFQYREIVAGDETFLYAEADGLVSCYKYVKGSQDGYGGRTMKLQMESGEVREFKGELWNSYTRHTAQGIPAHVEIGATDEARTFEGGGCFYAEAITRDLWNSLVKQCRQRQEKFFVCVQSNKEYYFDKRETITMLECLKDETAINDKVNVFQSFVEYQSALLTDFIVERYPAIGIYDLPQLMSLLQDAKRNGLLDFEKEGAGE